MNILIFSWRGPGHPNEGGAEIVTHEYAKAWVNAGHKVTLFTSNFPNGKSFESIEGVEIIRGGDQIGLFHISSVLWYLFKNKKRYDIVIDQFHGIPVFTPLFAQGIKIGFIHEVAKEVWWSNQLIFPLNYLYGFIGYYLEPLIFRLYRNVPFLTVSSSTKDDLIKWGINGNNITVIHNGVNVIKTKSKKSKTKVLMYLGAIARDKGIEDAIKIFSEIHKTHPGWRMWIVGKGEPNYLKLLNIPSYVKNYGFVSDSKKFDLLSRANLLINPSVREGWGLVNIEANSVSTPVIAYDVPGCRDSIKNNQTGLLCPKGDIFSVSREAVSLLNNKRRYLEMTIQAKKWSTNFTWKKATHQSLKFLKNLIK